MGRSKNGWIKVGCVYNNGCLIAKLHFEIKIEGESHWHAMNKGNYLFFGLISIKSHVLSKQLITCGKCNTSMRGRGRQFSRTDLISGKVNTSPVCLHKMFTSCYSLSWKKESYMPSYLREGSLETHGKLPTWGNGIIGLS